MTEATRRTGPVITSRDVDHYRLGIRLGQFVAYCDPANVARLESRDFDLRNRLLKTLTSLASCVDRALVGQAAATAKSQVDETFRLLSQDRVDLETAIVTVCRGQLRTVVEQIDSAIRESSSTRQTDQDWFQLGQTVVAGKSLDNQWRFDDERSLIDIARRLEIEIGSVFRIERLSVDTLVRLYPFPPKDFAHWSTIEIGADTLAQGALLVTGAKKRDGATEERNNFIVQQRKARVALATIARQTLRPDSGWEPLTVGGVRYVIAQYEKEMGIVADNRPRGRPRRETAD